MLAFEECNFPPVNKTSLAILFQHEFQFDIEPVRKQTEDLGFISISKSSLRLGSETETCLFNISLQRGETDHKVFHPER